MMAGAGVARVVRMPVAAMLAASRSSPAMVEWKAYS